jgi:hypothetical protein
MRIGFVLLVAVLGGCGKAPPPPDMNFSAIQSQLLQPSCAGFSVCHSKMGASNAGNLNLDVKADPWAALVGVPAENKQAKAEGRLRVKPCDPQNSFLYIKLTLPVGGDPNVGYGTSMPQMTEHIDSGTLHAISDWIARGALKDEPLDATGAVCNSGGGGGS